ncbi:acyl-CoA synthetase (AMP-forming)/AMP-acid ligase II [Virgibacillus natechei]|uniref:Acyl-CoA synthetase (AMP-forming)/AMP-acid ligase II n=1 Tax=Virgibacillus natechei TaxID=1216297 RepID=A0ABS4IKW2_9BACI|nr:long-chain-fatty-acid--CoA ligase [Virgibacillus natechei]MBP1971535.1 acyl-CoA synthetase (AMP-forming)/AMP-acid ligase II [Virgibacillus natechei]UZD11994.1 long-chain-fatty-acid--CoA ligase [Virgibacillus natechei]
MNIPNLLASQSRKFPNHEGIITPSERITYMEWDRTVNQLADSLLKRGVTKGDKVILHMPNTKEFLYTYFAVQRIGALIVPINAKLVHQEIMYILNHSDAKVFITHDLLFEQVKGMPKTGDLLYVKTGEVDGDWLSFEKLITEGSPAEIRCELTEDDEASLLYTSGTTGAPKGVVFTYRSILTVATMICIEMSMKPESRVLHMMPLSHSAQLHLFMIAGTYVGATHVLVPTFTPDLLLETVEKEKTTHFFGAPVAYLGSAKHPKIRTHDLTSMEYWVYGGAPLGEQEVLFIKEKFSTDRLMCVYGLTEAGPNGTLLGFDDQDKKAGSIGKRPALNCEIRLVNEDEEDVSQGEVGEIILRGEGNMKGYYKDPEKTQESLRGDWLYTGDMAKQDEDGFYWVVDRKKDVIISGGVNIFPQEIENILNNHPQISDVAIVGVPNPDWGETVKAYVVMEGEIENLADTCREFLKGKVADFKIPRIYEQLEALPRNATGKLLKNQLRERVEQ